jgi:hypothetical protein
LASSEFQQVINLINLVARNNMRLCFVSLLGGLLGVNIGLPAAIAAPAPVFQPIVPTIRQQLPKGWQMRLPSYLPAGAIELFPQVRSSRQGLMVSLVSERNCPPQKCFLIGAVAVTTASGFKSAFPKLPRTTPVDLHQGLRGNYFTQGQGDRLLRYLFWDQDGQRFLVGAAGLFVSQQDLTAIANSMVSEPPIKSR